MITTCYFKVECKYLGCTVLVYCGELAGSLKHAIPIGPLFCSEVRKTLVQLSLNLNGEHSLSEFIQNDELLSNIFLSHFIYLHIPSLAHPK